MRPKTKYEAVYPPDLGKGIAISNSGLTPAEKIRREKNKKNYRQIKRRPSKYSKEKKGTFEEFMRVSTAGSYFYPGFAHDIRYNLVKYSSICEREETLRRFVDGKEIGKK